MCLQSASTPEVRGNKQPLFSITVEGQQDFPCRPLLDSLDPCAYWYPSPREVMHLSVYAQALHSCYLLCQCGRAVDVVSAVSHFGASKCPPTCLPPCLNAPFACSIPVAASCLSPASRPPLLCPSNRVYNDFLRTRKWRAGTSGTC